MFYLTYMLSELRRRKGRTLLTALGLGVGVGLVVTVTALSAGLDRAQAQVLKPLTASAPGQRPSLDAKTQEAFNACRQYLPSPPQGGFGGQEFDGPST